MNPYKTVENKYVLYSEPLLCFLEREKQLKMNESMEIWNIKFILVNKRSN